MALKVHMMYQVAGLRFEEVNPDDMLMGKVRPRVTFTSKAKTRGRAIRRLNRGRGKLRRKKVYYTSCGKWVPRGLVRDPSVDLDRIQSLE